MAFPHKFMPEFNDESAGSVVEIIKDYILNIFLDKTHLAKQRRIYTKLVNLQDRKRIASSAEISLLSNLAFGLDTLEEASSNLDTQERSVRLMYAEKTLQNCAKIQCTRNSKTAGLPNSYLIALANLNLAYVYTLQDLERQATRHILEMFVVDPGLSRLHFAPVLWQNLFFPQLKQIMIWYWEHRQAILSDGQASETQPNWDRCCEDLNLGAAVSRLQSPGMLNSSRQVLELNNLDKVYEGAMDENTRQHAQYYKALLKSDSAHKRGIRTPPVEPPMNASNHVDLLESIMCGFQSFAISSN